jgi:hypothetical protein
MSNVALAVEKVEVEDLIEILKDALLEAEKRAGKSPLFQIKWAETEIGYTLETRAGGGLKAVVITADASITSEKVHRIKVHLEPTRPLKVKEEGSKKYYAVIEIFKTGGPLSGATKVSIPIWPFAESTGVIIPSSKEGYTIQGKTTPDWADIRSKLIIKENIPKAKATEVEIPAGGKETKIEVPKSTKGYTVTVSPVNKSLK